MWKPYKLQKITTSSNKYFFIYLFTSYLVGTASLENKILIKELCLYVDILVTYNASQLIKQVTIISSTQENRIVFLSYKVIIACVSIEISAFILTSTSSNQQKTGNGSDWNHKATATTTKGYSTNITKIVDIPNAELV